MNSYKEIVPELLSIESLLKKICGFYFCQNISLCHETKEKNLIHIKIDKINNLKFPKNLEKKYNFRDGFYINYNKAWYYKRNLKFGLSLKFIYYKKGNNFHFIFNSLYNYIPFEIGNILPIGRHIADLVSFELFMNDYHCLTGCAIKDGDNTTAFISPSYNGKTTLVKNKVEKGSKYIAEDIVIIDKNIEKIYPLNNFIIDDSRKQSGLLAKMLKNNNSILLKKQKLNKIIFYKNTFSDKNTNLTFDSKSFLISNSLFFLRNRFIRAIILKNNLGNKVTNNINEFNTTINTNQKILFNQINNFNFN